METFEQLKESRDQLHAEVERLKKPTSEIEGDSPENTETNPKSWVAWKVRAEKAEAELNAIGRVLYKAKLFVANWQTVEGLVMQRDQLLSDVERLTEQTEERADAVRKLAEEVRSKREQSVDAHLRAERAEAELANAKELLREIRDHEVNEADEADKFLRDHVPSELSKVRAEVERLLREKAVVVQHGVENLRRAEKAEAGETSLRAELAKERARLDWIFSQDARLFSDTETSGWFLFWGDTPACGSWQKERYDTPRAAVDAGMKENPK